MNYISVKDLEYAAGILQAFSEAQHNPYVPDFEIVCEYGTHTPDLIRVEGYPPCENAPEFFVPDFTPYSAWGSMVSRPAFLCREHTAELSGEEPEELPASKPIQPPE